MLFTLNTGREIPAIGFGTWHLTPDDFAKETVLSALEAGYRVIDTARIYGNERGVGEAIRESGIPREEIFLTTKVWNDEQGYDRTRRALDKSLERLGLDFVDLYLIHWPATRKRHDTWRALERLYQDSLIKAAGVANYTVEHLEQLANQSSLVPAVNQIEFHPFIYEQQRLLLDYCQEKGIVVQAYSPLRRIGSAASEALDDIAERLQRSPQQVVLRWCIQHETLPLPRSGNPRHIRDNYNVFDFSLEQQDMKALNFLSDGQRVTWDPAGMGR